MNIHKSTGFTILEAVVAVIILSALAAFALPRFGTVVEHFRSKEGVQALHFILQAQFNANADVDAGRLSSYAITDLDITVPALDNFSGPFLEYDGSGNHEAPSSTVTINSVAYPVYARVDRTGAIYSLYVQYDGTILCDTQVICTQMQYAPW